MRRLVLPDRSFFSMVKNNTAREARALGHTLGEFSRGTEFNLQFRAECLMCKAEVFVSYDAIRSWYRTPGWEIQHQCTGEV